MSIVKMLEISTAHIPEHTAEALGNTGRDTITEARLWSLIVYEPFADYGWIIYAHTSHGVLQELGHSELETLLEWCRKNAVDYLKLDCDAETDDRFPTFDW